MLYFKVSDWNAFAPGLADVDQWSKWSNNEYTPDPSEPIKPILKEIPPLLRRRFSDLGKCAAGAALPLLSDHKNIPLVFASRHGDVDLTLSLLNTIANEETLSPTGFSLAVHNSISGLFSIARKDPSEVTAIASLNGLIPYAILEAATQLQNQDNVLCVIYDAPLPDIYKPFAYSSPFPYAIAMVLSKEKGTSLSLEHTTRNALDPISQESLKDTEQDGLKAFISLLCQHTNSASFIDSELNTEWLIKR